MIQLTIFMEMTAFGQKPSKQDHHRPGVSSLPILLWAWMDLYTLSKGTAVKRPECKEP